MKVNDVKGITIDMEAGKDWVINPSLEYRHIVAKGPDYATSNWKWHHRLWLLVSAPFRYLFKGEIEL